MKKLNNQPAKSKKMNNYNPKKRQNKFHNNSKPSIIKKKPQNFF